MQLRLWIAIFFFFVSCNSKESEGEKLGIEVFKQRYPDVNKPNLISQKKFIKCYKDKFRDSGDSKEEQRKIRAEAYNDCVDLIEFANEQEKFDYFGRGFMKFSLKYMGHKKTEPNVEFIAQKSLKIYQDMVYGTKTQFTKHSMYFLGCVWASTAISSIDDEAKNLGEKYHPAKSNEWCDYETI